MATCNDWTPSQGSSRGNRVYVPLEVISIMLHLPSQPT